MLLALQRTCDFEIIVVSHDCGEIGHFLLLTFKVALCYCYKKLLAQSDFCLTQNLIPAHTNCWALSHPKMLETHRPLLNIKLNRRVSVVGSWCRVACCCLSGLQELTRDWDLPPPLAPSPTETLTLCWGWSCLTMAVEWSFPLSSERSNKTLSPHPTILSHWMETHRIC